MQANRLNDKKHIKLNECLQYSKPSFLPVLPFLFFNWQLCTQEHIQPFNQIIDFSQPMLQSLCVTRSYEFLHFPFSFDGMHHVLYKKKSIILPRFVQAHEHHHFQIASPRNPFKIMCCLTGKLLAVAKDVKVFNDSISIHKHPFTGGGGGCLATQLKIRPFTTFCGQLKRALTWCGKSLSGQLNASGKLRGDLLTICIFDDDTIATTKCLCVERQMLSIKLNMQNFLETP